MTHIKITTATPDGRPSVEVDGVEVNMKILARDFWVEFPEEMTATPVVHMLVAADTLDVDLPDAVVAAVQAADEEGAA